MLLKKMELSIQFPQFFCIQSKLLKFSLEDYHDDHDDNVVVDVYGTTDTSRMAVDEQEFI